MAESAKTYDYVIIDTPPINTVADAQIISTYVDGVVLVTKSGVTTTDELSDAKDAVLRAGGNLCGVVLNDMNKPFTAYALDSETMARWEHIIAVRTVVNGALEEARAAKVIGKSLEADVHLTVPEGDVFLADENPAALADLFIVSKVELTVGGELAVKVENAAGTKCPRCWKHSLEANAEGLCPRCAEVVKHLHLTELL